MEAYIVLVVLLIIAWALAGITKSTRYFLIAVYFLLFVFAFSRDASVGTDFSAYRYSFISTGSQGVFRGRAESTWSSIYMLFYTQANFRIFVFVFYGLLYYYLIRFISKESRIPLLSVLLYYVLGYYFDSYNILRQSFAAIFVYYSVIYIEERNILKFVAIIIIGGFLHVSVLLFMPMYFVTQWIKNSKYILITILISTLIIGYSRSFVDIELLADLGIFNKYQMYLSMEKSHVSFWGKYINIIHSIIVLISIILVNDNKTKLYLSIVVLGVGMNNMLFQYAWLFRFYGPLFLAFMIITIPNIIFQIKSKQVYYSFCVIVSMYSILMFYTLLKHNANGVVPYHLFY
jgi:hypothetical protein